MKKIIIVLALLTLFLFAGCRPVDEGKGEKVTLDVDGWRIIGNLQVPSTDEPAPAVVLLHMKPTDRSSYNRLANLLEERGIASLRIDMRGHGESTNLGGKSAENDNDAWKDAVEALKFLQSRPGVDPKRIGILGASYGGEHAAHAGKALGEGADVVKAYVIMSSGSFSEDSIKWVQDSNARWLFIAAEDDGNPEVPKLMKTAAETGGEEKAKLDLFETGGHGTYLFEKHKDLEQKIAEWFVKNLKE